MIRCCTRFENALTGLEAVILIVILTGITGLFFIHFLGGDNTDHERVFPGGVVAESIYMSGDHIQPVGNIFGFPSVSNPAAKPPRIISREDPKTLGAVRVVVSLFIGDTGAIDMDRVGVQWNGGTGYRTVSRSWSPLLVCPNWTISGKYNMLPGRTADSDDWLEPGEQFEITLCPAEGVPPYGSFTLLMSPEGSAMPLRVTRTVPVFIEPVMNLG